MLRERTVESRFDALHSENLTPLVGREEELELLLRRWQQVQDSEGRVVLLTGEPGIGKSRLIAALQSSLEDVPHTALRYFCLPHQQGSPLQPVLSQLQHAAGFSRDDAPAAKRAKLEALLAKATKNAAETMPLFADLLGLSEGKAPDVDPQRGRRRILAALIDQLEGLARKRPVLMLFEDVQWADPTTLELLSLTVERLQSLPVFLVITHRPDFQPPWAGQPHVTTQTLNRLSRRERMTLVEHVTGGKALPPALLEQIVERTDGVPLFVEELTKAVLESEQLHEDSDRYVVDQPARQLEIPTTLQASLMARVDRLGSAREVLQIGAAIGREFSYELLAAVAGLPDAVLQDALIRLTEAEMVFLRGTPPNAVYVLQARAGAGHRLLRHAARPPPATARRNRAGAGKALSRGGSQSTPEVVAQQFERAATERKGDPLLAAGRRPRSAPLRLEGIDRALLKRDARRHGDAGHHGARRAGACDLPCAWHWRNRSRSARTPRNRRDYYRRADALSRQLPGHGREQFLATWGLWLHCFMTDQPHGGVPARRRDGRDRPRGRRSRSLMEAYHATDRRVCSGAAIFAACRRPPRR